MFLTHGLNQSGELVSVEDTASGRTALRCPFCSEFLIARKGAIKEHHFAHAGDTCAESKATIQQTGIPFYDIATGISKSEVNLLEKFGRYRDVWLTLKQRDTAECLVVGGLLEPRLDKPNKYSLTQLGRDLLEHHDRPYKKGSILPDVILQESMFPARLAMLQYQDLNHGTQAARFYQLRLQAILQQHLYVLKIQLKQETICYPLIKVGLTTRPDIELRIAEIKRDLQKYGEVESITMIGFYKHYGCLERLIHKRFAASQFLIGNHTEYFHSIDTSYALNWLGLQGLGKRKVDGVTCRSIYREHARKVRIGQNKAKLIKKAHLGRPPKNDDTLVQDHPDIENAFEKSLSLRKASATTGKAINTVRKVYAALKKNDGP
ncbi:GIY-YIG nuclease family protein [Shewanella baltica]|uniref:GIY-YIG nuclease family protein n=1 Tax=Shewanella baltica TaxID=62322 RepID=UPI00217E87CF|nr:GIY-YIG nuclease family protein [Shewanella baltica]MCS6271827.1 GIY-YIG nuclease family protein [Shewanella baltica]